MPRDRSAFEQFFEREYAPVVRALTAVCGDLGAAEDAAQEAFARLYVHFPRISRYERPGAWVRRVAINLVIGERRRKRPAPRDETPPAEPSSERVDLLRALGSLTRMQRAAVVLHYLEDRSTEDTAEILGCAPSTARVHLHRARARLAEMLGEEAADADR